MSENKIKAFALKVDVWEKQNNEWKDYCTTYASDGIASHIVDFGKYWEVDGGDLLALHTEDGKMVYSDLDELCDVFLDGKIDPLSLHWGNDIMSLSIGEWHETVYRNYKVRFTRIADLPRLSKVNTLKYSDLSTEAQTRVRIYGEPLFRQGEALNNKIYMPSFAEKISDVWESYVHCKCGVKVKIAVDESAYSADYYSRNMMMTAPNETVLWMALGAIGCVNAADIAISTRSGEGEDVKSVTAKFSLVNKFV